MAEPVDILRRVGANVAHAARCLAARVSLPRDGGLWLSLRLSAPLDEMPSPQLPWDRNPNLLDVLEILDVAAGDPEVDGVFLELVGVTLGWSKVQSLRRAVGRVRERGKPVVVWAERLDEQSLLLATAATQVWLPESGQVFLVGVRADTFHLRDLLARFEIEPDVVRIGSHKTAAESLTRSSMSPEQREQLDALADDWFRALVEGVAEGRDLAVAEVRDLVDRGPYTAPAAVEAGLVDACVYPDEVDRRLAPQSSSARR